MLFLDDTIEPIVASKNHRCRACGKKGASWLVDFRDPDNEIAQAQKVPMCGWCVMYSNKSAWGYSNRDELVHVGRAAKHQGERTHREVILDELGRLSAKHADQFMLGVAFTTKAFQKGGRFAPA